MLVESTFNFLFNLIVSKTFSLVSLGSPNILKVDTLISCFFSNSIALIIISLVMYRFSSSLRIRSFPDSIPTDAETIPISFNNKIFSSVTVSGRIEHPKLISKSFKPLANFLR